MNGDVPAGPLQANATPPRARLTATVDELRSAVETKRQALARTAAGSLVVDEPEAVIFGQFRSWQPSYNVQLVVDAATQVVIDAEAVATPTDAGQLAPGAARVAAVVEVQPSATGPAVTLLADAGYSSANDAVACERLGLAPVLPVTRTVNPHGRYFNRMDFAYDADGDRMICPAGKIPKPLPTPDRGAVCHRARKTDCRAFHLKPRCTATRARTVHRLINEAALDRVGASLKADPGRMAQRAQSVEPAIATLKRWMHGGRFLLRGKAKATTEIKLAALAFSLKRLASIHGAQALIRAFA